MENEFQSEQDGFDASPLEDASGGDETLQQTETQPPAEPDTSALAPVTPETVAPAVPTPAPAARPVQAPYAGIEAPNAPIFQEGELQVLGEYLPNDVTQIIQNAITRREDAMKTHYEQRVNAAIQAFEGQQQYARENGIPDAYIPDVRRYSNSVPENLRGTPQGARMALLMGLYDRAEQTGGDINTELANYLSVARPVAPVPAAQPPRVTTQAKPISPEAQVTRSSITSAPAPAAKSNGNRDPFFDNFAHLKAYAEE